jgi:hypothetical protein
MEGQTMPEPVDARVFQTPHGFQVHPPVVVKRRREYFTLLNHTKWRVNVTFHELPVEPGKADIDPAQPKTFEILDAEPGVYPYSVAVTITDVQRKEVTLLAQGGSNPKIIIDF